MNFVVSIIIPCYNKKPYVAAAIQSALNQTYPCDVIVVDDGSTDGSLEEVRQFEGRIRWVTGKNRGGSAARNIGLKMATGDFIQFLDADDILPPEKVSHQISLLKKASSLSVACCPWSYFEDNGKIASPSARSYWNNHQTGSDLLVDMWLDGGFFPPHAWLMSRELVNKAGHWNESLTGDDDGEFFGRILLAADNIQFCETTEVLYRNPPVGSVSRDKSLKSALSFWHAFESISAALLMQRNDRLARRACLARARKTGYAWQNVNEVLALAAAWEKQNFVFDLSPSLPPLTRVLVALLGLRRGLTLKKVLTKK